MNLLLRSLSLAFSLAAGALSVPAAGTAPTPFAELVLHDQFDQVHWFAASSNTVTVIAIGDRPGSLQVDGWVAALKQRYGGKLCQVGVADVAAVPAPLRGFIRKKFKAKYPMPILLDWKGESVGRFPYTPGEANLLAVDQRGAVLVTVTGPDSEAQRQKLFAVIDPLLPPVEGPRPEALPSEAEPVKPSRKE